MTENARTRKRKLLRLPTGDEIYIPVISKISFIDPVTNYQETSYTIKNGPDASRETHIDQVYPVDAFGNQITEDTIAVERVDIWKTIDPDRAQQTQIGFDNITGADLSPPHFIGHQKTHKYRYYKDPDNPDNDGIWADFELIDECLIKDPDRGQETLFTLKNPGADDMTGQSSGLLEDISDDYNGFTKPLRVDPFQNLVNFHAREDAKTIVFSIAWAPVILLAYPWDQVSCYPSEFSYPPSAALYREYVKYMDVTGSHGPILQTLPPLPPELTVSGEPSITLTPPTYEDYKYLYAWMRPNAGGNNTAFTFRAQTVQGNGPGCYEGTLASGWIDGGNIIYSDIGTISVDASMVGLNVSGVDWVIDNISMFGGSDVFTSPGDTGQQIFVFITFVAP